jgi:hypothetical protein
MVTDNRNSRYVDGTLPNRRHGMQITTTGEGYTDPYAQPDVTVEEVGEGATVEDGSRTLCERMADETDFDFGEWWNRHKTKIYTGLAIYGGYRLLRR